MGQNLWPIKKDITYNYNKFFFKKKKKKKTTTTTTKKTTILEVFFMEIKFGRGFPGKVLSLPS